MKRHPSILLSSVHTKKTTRLGPQTFEKDNFPVYNSLNRKRPVYQNQRC